MGTTIRTPLHWLRRDGIVAKGIKLTSYTQIVFTVVEVGVLVLLIALAATCFPSAPASWGSPASGNFGGAERAGRQSQHRQGAQPHRPAVDPCPRR